MKQLLLLLLIASSIIGCKKEADPEPDHFRPGVATARRNGIPWTASVSFQPSITGNTDSGRRFAMWLRNYRQKNGDSTLSEYLYFDFILRKPYRAQLTDSLWPEPKSEAVRMNMYLRGNLFYETRNLLKSEPRWLEITSYDSSRKTISGGFALSFISGNEQDTVRFEDGSFTAMFPEWYE